jgi:hypothetical protein
VRAGTPHRRARAGRGLRVREVSPTGAIKKNRQQLKSFFVKLIYFFLNSVYY